MLIKNEIIILGMLPDSVPSLILRSGFARVTVYRLLAILINTKQAHKQIVMENGKVHRYDYLPGPAPKIKKVKTIKPKKFIIKNKEIKLAPLIKESVIIKHHHLMCMFGM